MLLDAAITDLHEQGIREIVVVSDRLSASGIAFANAVGATYDYSEYRLERTAGDAESSGLPVRITVRDATAEDRDLLVSILARAFEDPEEQVRPNVDAGLAETTRRFVVAHLDGLPVGVVRVGEWGGIGDITALAIVPEQQGKGFGRELLQWAVQDLNAAGFSKMALEVESENANALGLYRSCGFEVTNEYVYSLVHAG
jgi:ribosomal protein S18 acetylase RimI-like enzyme